LITGCIWSGAALVSGPGGRKALGKLAAGSAEGPPPPMIGSKQETDLPRMGLMSRPMPPLPRECSRCPRWCKWCARCLMLFFELFDRHPKYDVLNVPLVSTCAEFVRNFEVDNVELWLCSMFKPPIGNAGFRVSRPPSGLKYLEPDLILNPLPLLRSGGLATFIGGWSQQWWGLKKLL
jgi:hypothetical protein